MNPFAIIGPIVGFLALLTTIIISALKLAAAWGHKIAAEQLTLKGIDEMRQTLANISARQGALEKALGEKVAADKATERAERRFEDRSRGVVTESIGGPESS